MRARPEVFGGIVAIERPAALVYVDRERASRLGIQGGSLWDGPAHADAPLTAPVEVHLMLTSKCPVRCAGCYAGSTPAGAATGDLDTDGWKAVIDELAAAGVFHVAMGGGESVLRDDLFELARHARARGVTPNLTTSGVGVDGAWAKAAARLFGRINVSLDGPRSVHARSRGVTEAAYDVAVEALQALRRRTRRVGINCVVSRVTYPHLDALAAVARRLRLDELELLRFKPAGRGRGVFEAYDLTDDQRVGLLPLALDIARRTRLRLRMDCSLVPFVAAHDPDPELLERFGVVGCDGGSHLAAVRADGALTACSFWERPEPSGGEALRKAWREEGAFAPFRRYVRQAPAPCDTCAYLHICRGGCRAVAVHVTGDPDAPDPGCPRVRGLTPATHPSS